MWYEIAVEASRVELAELLTDVAQAGAGRPLCDRDIRMPPASLADRVRDALGADAGRRVFATAPQARVLLRIAFGKTGLRIDRLRRIERGRFRFSVEAYSEATAEEIRAALRDLPAGVAVDGFTESVERHPEDKGVELFAPAHDYVYRAQGQVNGSAPGLLEIYRRLEDLDFVDVGRLEIEGPEVAPEELA